MLTKKTNKNDSNITRPMYPATAMCCRTTSAWHPRSTNSHLTNYVQCRSRIRLTPSPLSEEEEPAKLKDADWLQNRFNNELLPDLVHSA